MQVYQISVEDKDELLLLQILQNLKIVQNVSLLPTNEPLLTLEAVSKLLHVSTAFVMKLVEKKEIPYTKVHQNYCISLDDALAYQTNMRAEQAQGLLILAEEAQKLNLGYNV